MPATADIDLAPCDWLPPSDSLHCQAHMANPEWLAAFAERWCLLAGHPFSERLQQKLNLSHVHIAGARNRG